MNQRGKLQHSVAQQKHLKRIIDVISKAGVAVPYQHTLQQVNRIAEAVQQISMTMGPTYHQAL